MTEYTPIQQPVGGGHNPNTETLLLELYRLLTIFFSSKNFAELRRGTEETRHPWDPIARLEAYEEDEITRILLAVAITARVIDDNRASVFERSGPCGELLDDVSKTGASRPLFLREACNKIIHVRTIHFNVDQTEVGQPYLNPIIYLYGQHRGSKWKATLDVVAFAKEYCTCIDHL